MNQTDPRLYQAVLDALDAHVCLVDRSGRIIAVNRAWREFGKANRGAGDCVGTLNSLEICWRAAQAGEVNGERARTALIQVLNGQSARAELEYPCHSDQESRWFLMTITPYRYNQDGPGQPDGAVISHLNITHRKREEDERRQVLHELGDASARKVPLAMVCLRCGSWARDGHWGELAQAFAGAPHLEVLPAICPLCR